MKTNKCMTDGQRADLLAFDPLANAERATGKSYKESPNTLDLGVMTALTHNQSKNEILRASDDSPFSMDMQPFLDLVQSLGFEIILEETFMGRGWGDEPCEERFVILADRQRGALIVTDSFGGKERNRACLFCTWQPSDTKAMRSWLRGSGGWHNGQYTGEQYDVREAVALRLRMMDTTGTFISPWLRKDRFLWFLHYGENSKDVNYKAINAERISRFPDWAKEMMGLSAKETK